MIWHIIFTLLASLVFLYLAWRSLTEEYGQELSLSYGWISLLAFVIGSRVWFLVSGEGWLWSGNPLNWLMIWRYPGLNYWGGVVGMIGATYWFCQSKKIKTWNFFEDVLNLIDVFILIKLTGNLITGKFAWSLIGWWLIGAVVLMVNLVIKEKYRSFSWYKSGKKGFSFFASLFVFGALSALFLFFMGESTLAILPGVILGILSIGSLLVLGEILPTISFKKRKNNG